MTIEAPIDGRRQRELKDEFLRRAAVELSGDGKVLPVGTVTAALLDGAARIGEEVTRRLDKVPEKQLANFLMEARLGRDPARPATVALSFVLADASTGGVIAPAGTRLSTSGDGDPVIFETIEDLSLAGGRIVAVRGVDAVEDRIFLPAETSASNAQPASTIRRVKSGASTGAEKLQIGPAAGLAPGMIIRLGAAANSPQHRITKVEGDLITFDPGLGQSVGDDTPVTTVTEFAPFAPGTRNRQTHVLYLGHETLFDLPSAVTLKIRGLNLPQDTQWHWWGVIEGDQKPAWRDFKADTTGGALVLCKPKGKTLMIEVHGRQKFWLRASLPGRSSAISEASDIRVAVAVNELCGTGPGDACDRDNEAALEVDFEAIANTTPVVPNKPFHPFGREPRLFDTFYVGCAEALSKPGAEVTLCFELGGPEFGRLAIAGNERETQIFGIGTDNLVHRARLLKDVQPRLDQLPPVPETSGPTVNRDGLAAAMASDGVVHLAAAGRGGIHRASFDASTATLAAIEWRRSTGGKPTDEFKKVAVLASEGMGPTFYGLVGDKLFTWKGDTIDASEPAGSNDLLVADNGAVVIIHSDSPLSFTVLHPNGTKIKVGPPASQLEPPVSLLEADRAVWHSLKPARVFIASRDDTTRSSRRLKVVGINLDNHSVLLDVIMDDPAIGHPTGFLRPNSGISAFPPLIFATPAPRRVQWLNDEKRGDSVIVDDVSFIGTSTNKFRRFFETERHSLAQRDDFGVIYRGAADPSWTIQRVDGLPLHLIENANRKTEFVVFGDDDSGDGFRVTARNDDGYAVIQPFPRDARGLSSEGDGHLYRVTSKGTATRPQGYQNKVLRLDSDTQGDQPNDSGPILVALATGDGTPAGIWRLKPAIGGTNLWEHDPPTTFPPAKTYFLLEAEAQTSQAEEGLFAVHWPDPHLFPLHAVGDPSTDDILAPIKLGDKAFLKINHRLLTPSSEGATRVLLRGTPIGSWSEVGPTQPVNPTLSWEYWNGRAWWALDGHDLNDETANLLLSKGVRFTVPADLAPTDVGGKQNHWIRARLIGGEYGQARVTVKTTADDKVDPKTSTQEIDRDITVIRAPYVARLRVGYCAPAFVLPEVVITEDSLGIRNQTSANTEGQPVEIFTPVWNLMNPGRVQTSVSTADGCDSCNKKTAPLADDSLRCDPCARPLEPASTSSPPIDSAEVPRAVMIGLSSAPCGTRIALFADAAPLGGDDEVVVEVLHKGSFRKLDAVDGTCSLTEPGIISFPLDFRFDQTDIMGSESFWLRLRPKKPTQTWSPSLRGFHLNATNARSSETRALATLGASSGIPDQKLALAQPPIEVASLKLFVRERLVDAERANFAAEDIATDIEGMIGPWVRWQEVKDFVASKPADRHYTLDPETGAVCFGDGIRGAIPPLGATVLAREYRRVIGALANATKAGDELQLVSPIAGVDRVFALDPSAGGVDAETNDMALRRAPAKLRHGNRIHTLADLEDFAFARSPQIAQAHAQRWHGGVRLVVALKGEDPIPYPARLRALARDLTEHASFGLARPGGLTVVGPRLLPVLISVNLIPNDQRQLSGIADTAKTRIRKFLDVATGGIACTGWPIGAIPTSADLGAALRDVVDKAVIYDITLTREDGTPLPAAIAPDRLICYGDMVLTYTPAEAAT